MVVEVWSVGTAEAFVMPSKISRFTMQVNVSHIADIWVPELRESGLWDLLGSPLASLHVCIHLSLDSPSQVAKSLGKREEDTAFAHLRLCPW